MTALSYPDARTAHSPDLHPWLAAVAALVSLVALLGWLLDLRVLATVVPGRPPMVPMTSVLLLVAAAALASLHRPVLARRLAWAQLGLAVLVVLAHVAGVAAFVWDSPWSWSSRITGAGVAASAVGTLLLASGHPREGQAVAFITFLFSALVAIGHVFPTAELYVHLPGSGVAIHTVAALFALSIGQLLSFPSVGLSAALGGGHTAGRASLQLMLVGIAAALVLCALVVIGYRRGLYDPDTAVVLISWAAIALLGTMLWALAVAVQRADQARVLAERQRNSLRQMMVAALTHDLRSPLQAATMSAWLLERQLPAGQGRDAFERLQASHRRVDRLLRSLLDTLALESGEAPALQPAALELTALLESVIHENAARLEGRVRVEGPPVTGWWDHDALFRVVENLLLNAVKYGDGTAPIVCRIVPDGERVRLAVSNQGPPIPPEEWEAIFRPFSRGQAGQASTEAGWGVGLAYARAVVGRHGGSVRVERSDAEGTSFEVQLPLDGRAAAG